MAKDIEEGLVDAIEDALMDLRFNYPKFSRLMSDKPPRTYMAFMNLIAGYMAYLAVFDDHGYFPNGHERDAPLAAELVEILRAWAEEHRGD